MMPSMRRLVRYPRKALGRLIAVLVFAAVSLWALGTWRLDLRDVEEKLRRELPMGSDIADVRSYLASRDIGAVRNNVDRSLRCRLPETGGPPIFPHTFFIVLHFDEADKLRSIEVRSGWLGA